MTTPREAAEKAFHDCEGNTQQSLKAAFDAYEAETGASRDALAEALDALSTLAIQSDRYRSDPDFRDAVDTGLGLTRLAHRDIAADRAEAYREGMRA